jgi:2-polyprenyl-6-methoxyphenol hydroxylase-like FAD-dependent oxidoreductase
MKTDVVIVGGGPGGTASAMYLARHGVRSVIVERETFPRYHIGESMTGEGGLLLRELGFADRMREDRHPVKVGLTVFGTSRRSSWWVPVMGRDENWNMFEQSTWQARRSVFDKMLLDEAVA